MTSLYFTHTHVRRCVHVGRRSCASRIRRVCVFVLLRILLELLLCGAPAPRKSANGRWSPLCWRHWSFFVFDGVILPPALLWEMLTCALRNRFEYFVMEFGCLIHQGREELGKFSALVFYEWFYVRNENFVHIRE